VKRNGLDFFYEAFKHDRHPTCPRIAYNLMTYSFNKNINIVSLFLHSGRVFVEFQLSLEEGEFLVRLARKAVEEYLKKRTVIDVPKDVPAKLMERCGVFVTLNRVEGKKKELRGCIGLPYPETPLAQAVIKAAISSATQDPRFPPVSLKELNRIVFELSVLTPP
jgi:hypothetical protein